MAGLWARRLTMRDVTQLLLAIEQGERQAADDLLPLVYAELRSLAARKMANERAGQTIDATALVHEAYVRLVDGQQSPQWQGRGHFFASAAEAMRRILVENARRKRSLKRGGNLVRQEFDEGELAAPGVPDNLVELDAALDRLAAKDLRKAELVKLRFFAGLTNAQAADALGIAAATADRDWAYARAWLFRELSDGTRAPDA